MKRMIALCLALALLTGCSAPKGGGERELVVFAAASLTETLTVLGERFMAENEGISVVFSFDSSGTLQKQIEEGAACDVFVSAGQRQMDALEGIYNAATRIDLLENKVALIAAGDDAPASFAELAQRLQGGDVLLAVCGADVPVGQYTGEIFAHYGLCAKELEDRGCITYGSNVKELVTQVREAVVDCGIVYATDAVSAGLPVLDTATSEMCGRVIYPAAALRASAQPEAARAFLELLASDAADEMFANVGFVPMG